MTRFALFDLDGTLVDSLADIQAALDRLMAAQSRPGFTREEVRKMVGDGVPVLIQRACAARSLAPSPMLTAEFLADYEARAAEVTRPFPGMVAALEVLKAAGWRMAVCTNKPERAAIAVLEQGGLAPFFETVGGGDSFPVRKPHPGHPLAILARMGATPGAAVLVGDHHNDTRAARAAGMAAVFAAWGYGEPEMAEGAPVAAAPGDLAGLLGPAG